MEIGIIGGGAIGLLTAAHLAKKHNITIYVRRQVQKDAINDNGLQLLPAKLKLNVTALLISEMKTEEIYVICVKQYQLFSLQSIIRDVKNPVVFLQNGMGHIDFICNNLSQDIIVGTCEHGAIKINDHMIKQTGNGEINLALLQGEDSHLNMIVDSLHSHDFPVFRGSSWFDVLASKLVVNAVVNPLTALFQVKNGALLANKHLLTLAEKLSKETSEVLGMDASSQWNHVREIIEVTKANNSSMMLDILYKRKTEIDGITGYILDHAEKELPYTLFVYEGVKALELAAGGEGN